MIGGEHQHVGLAQPPRDAGQGRIDFPQRARVPHRIAPVSVEHIGVDQVDEEKPFPHAVEDLAGLAQPVRVAFGVHRLGDSATVVDVGNLAHADGAHAAFHEPIEHGAGRGRLGEVLAVVGALEVARAVPHEGARDHPREPVLLAHRARRLAPRIELLQRHDLLVRRDLEDAVRAGVDDGQPGAQVLRAELLEDHRPAGRLVAQVARCSREPLPFAQEVRGKSAGESSEAFLEHHPHHFPVAGGGVLALGLLRHLAVGGSRRLRRPAAGNAGDVSQTPALEIGQLQTTDAARAIPQRIRARVAIGCSIGKLACAAGIDHDGDEPAHLNTCRRRLARP